MSDQVKLIYLRPENWRSKSQTHEILGWCKEAPKVEEHIAVWVRPIEKTPTPGFRAGVCDGEVRHPGPCPEKKAFTLANLPRAIALCRDD